MTMAGTRSALGALVLLAAITALAPATGRAAPQPRAGDGEQTFTPVIQDVLSPPRWFRGIDNRVHIEYELRLINGFPVPATVESIQVRRGGGAELDELTGDRLLTAMSPLGRPTSNETTIPPGSVAVAYIDLTVDGPDQLPKRILHSTTVGVDPSLAAPLPVPEAIVETGAPARVVQQRPIRIDAPLSGPNWSTIIGAHRRALEPVNGSRANGERFAIDWNRLDQQDRPAFGDPASLSSSPSYGAPVLAVADAKVVKTLDGVPDQVPDDFTPVGTAEQLDGNVVVLKLDRDVYAGYAHLIPGSVAVERGDVVQAGDVLGRLGNSGNSSGPHLHFQVMNAPSLLASDSLPFVLSRFRLRGIVPSLDAFGDAVAGQTPVPFETQGAGPYRNRGPVGIDIFDLP
ncbi:MAG: peptidoglycan DD-metalloendopeptidase family protein [Solirubrobacterales bacterium]|nr:peptidoglycan DD-metalloendopeptidase family protein [Solirubrobacterales bacterium]